MPSRAYTSFLRTLSLVKPVAFNKVSMPSRAYTSFLPRYIFVMSANEFPCQCPLGPIPHFYTAVHSSKRDGRITVSMPSRAYTSFLQWCSHTTTISICQCQCPLGLIPHFYIDIPFAQVAPTATKCQCPLGLIPHFYDGDYWGIKAGVAWCQCPLGLIPHFYGTPSKI